MIYLKTFLALIIVLVLMLFLAFILKRFGRFSGFAVKDRKLFVEDSIMLSNNKKVILMRCENKSYLILLGDKADMVVDYYNRNDV